MELDRVSRLLLSGLLPSRLVEMTEKMRRQVQPGVVGQEEVAGKQGEALLALRSDDGLVGILRLSMRWRERMCVLRQEADDKIKSF